MYILYQRTALPLSYGVFRKTLEGTTSKKSIVTSSSKIFLATPTGFEPAHYLKLPFIHKRATSAASSPFELQNTTRSIPFLCQVLSHASRYTVSATFALHSCPRLPPLTSTLLVYHSVPQTLL